MQVHVFRREDTAWNRPFFYFLMSDLHIGHVACRQKLIASELAMARAAGARILINGDVFDAINPKDKRFALSQIAKPLRGEDDMEAASVAMAFKLLAPYADLIDLIGIGNHEEAWIRRSAADMVGRLIRELHANLRAGGNPHTIRHGGISGFIRTYLSYDVDAPLARNSHVPRALSHTLAYHHGSGGDAPVTKGQIEFSRKVAHVIADAYWMGHKHNKTYSEDCILDLSTKNQIKYRQRLSIQTASYLENWKATGQDNPLGYTYAESSNSPPKPLGGLVALPHAPPVQGRGRTHQAMGRAVRQHGPADRARGGHLDRNIRLYDSLMAPLKSCGSLTNVFRVHHEDVRQPSWDDPPPMKRSTLREAAPSFSSWPIRASFRWRLADGGLAVVDVQVGDRADLSGEGWQTIFVGPVSLAARLALSAPDTGCRRPGEGHCCR